VRFDQGTRARIAEAERWLLAGVQPSHGSSLAELLSQHGLVKVQLNAACEGSDAAGAQLAEAAGTLRL
jgi:hypothetical protein